MAQINEDLETLKTARDNMKTALGNKGQIVNNDIRTYASAITNIPSGSGSGDVKLFSTVEEMQADPDAQEGDLAIVYKEEIQPVTEESEFDSCTFPNTVVLDEAFSDEIYGSFSSNGSEFFDGRIYMTSSSFRFDGYGESDEIRVEYTSSDGITYTRTDGGEELVEFGTTIKWESGYGELNSVIGNFMKISGNYFKGLYNYALHQPIPYTYRLFDMDMNNFNWSNTSRGTFLDNFYTGPSLFLTQTVGENIKNIVNSIYANKTSYYCLTFLNTDRSIAYIYNGNSRMYYNSNDGKLYIPQDNNLDRDVLYTADLSSGEYSTTQIEFSTVDGRKVYELPSSCKYLVGYMGYDTSIATAIIFNNNNSKFYYVGKDDYIEYNDRYILTSTQLDATADYVYGKHFLRKK